MTFQTGDRVQYSDNALRSARDSYLSQDHPDRRSQYKAHYESKRAVRGTVTAILPADSSRGVCAGIEVTTDSGSVIKSLTHLWAKVENEQCG